KRALPCGGEPLACSRSELGGTRAGRAELRAKVMCLLEVVADDLVDLVRALAGGSLQPGRIAFVELRSRLLRDPQIRRVANQDVAETETVLIGEDRDPRLDELLPSECHQQLAGRFPLLGRRQLGDRPAPELL